MFIPFQFTIDEIECPSPGFSSVVACRDGLFAASFGQGIFHKRHGRWWESHDEGLPEETVVNRLQLVEGTLYVCTNKGLFYYDEDVWCSTDITTPCYQVLKRGDFFAAATEYGLWCKLGYRWRNIAYPNLAVYDLLLTPQYYILGLHNGISLYDRYTDSWAEFPLGTAVTCLAVHRGRLLGVTADGELVRGDQTGGFDKISFKGLSVYSLRTTETGVYACSNRGLYRLAAERQLQLRSLLLGYPVTDINGCGNCIYIATLNQGLKKVVMQ